MDELIAVGHYALPKTHSKPVPLPVLPVFDGPAALYAPDYGHATPAQLDA